jgi:CPA1 family monovalent cation:H+ antiporter
MVPRLRTVFLVFGSPYLSGTFLATFSPIVTMVHALFEPCLRVFTSFYKKGESMTDITTIVRMLIVLLLIALTVILVTRRLSVPYTLGLVVVGLLISIVGLLPDIHLTPELVLFVFLPALLFEGSWSMQLKQLRDNWLPIFLLVGPGLLISLLLIALLLHFLAGLEWSLAFLLGALLSPTDPVAVLGLFRQLQVNVHLSSIIEGESLFNDGVAGALYQTFLSVVLLSLHGEPSSGLQGWLEGVGLFLWLRQVGGRYWAWHVDGS